MTQDRILASEWAEPHYFWDPAAAPGPCPVCGAAFGACVHEPTTEETIQIMAAAAKKAASSVGPSGVPVEAAPEEGEVVVADDASAAEPEPEPEPEPEVEVEAAPEVVADAAPGPSPVEAVATPGVTSNFSTPAPELDPSTPSYAPVLVGSDGIHADWYDAVSEALVVFNRTVEQEFRHEGARQVSRRQMFVRGQVVPKAQIEALNATAVTPA